jgi:hypothetical protein
MKKTCYCIVVLAFTMVSCNSNPKQTEYQEKTFEKDALVIGNPERSGDKNFSNTIISTPGVLKLNADSLYGPGPELLIYNPDGSVFGKIMQGKSPDFEPVMQLKNKKKDIKIRAYYPDFYIIHFDCNGIITGKYEILVNGNLKYITPQEGVTLYYDWDEYLPTCLIQTNEHNPMRSKPSPTSEKIIVDDYTLTGFEILEVNHEWIKVICGDGCAPCLIDNENRDDIIGWIRWRNGNTLLLELFYSC